MRRLARHLFTLCSAVSLLLCVAVCVLWVRARTGSDHAEWDYARRLPDGSAASAQVSLVSDNRLWLNVFWGRSGPYAGDRDGYYRKLAAQSGGRPRLTFRRQRDDRDGWTFGDLGPDFGTSGGGPLRWLTQTRDNPPLGERFRKVRVGVSHWLAVVLLLAPPLLWLGRVRRSRRARRLGHCPACGYDLRASAGRCPECGTERAG